MFSTNLKFNISPFLGHKFRNSSEKFPAATAKRRSLNNSEDLKVRIKERIKGKVVISPSAYDTAWVAMVPAREYSGRKPHFPACLDWIVEHQNPDGSWGLQSQSLVKDSLSCTLACLLALRKWNVAPHLLHKGLEFIKSNASAAICKDQLTPIGFDIVFPMMFQYANELGLSLPLDQDFLDIMLRNRDSQLKRNKNLEYVAEGLGNSMDLNTMLMQQRSNGSLFNSPATTAAVLIQCYDERCLEFLNSLLSVFKTWVPTIHPVDVYARLCLVDQLQGLGVDRFFQSEIHSILHETYRLWQQKDEEFSTDVTCRAMAFRLLRLEGYHVSSDELAEYVDEENFFDAVGLESSGNGTETILELYKASQVRLPEDDGSTLEKLHDWTCKFLKQQLRCKTILDKHLERKVEFNLKNYHGILDAVKYRRNIDLYDINHFRILKAAYRCPTVNNEDLLLLSEQDFMNAQAQNQKELQMLERWYDDCRLDNMEYGRNVIRVSHFLNANNFPDPQLSEARLAFAKTMTLVTRLDDFFDHHGSREDSLLIIELIRQWNEPSTTRFPSKEVEILYSALHTTVTDIAEKAYPVQGRCIKPLLIHLWVEILTSFMSEMDSCTAEIPPDIHEYMAFAWISIGCRICILVAIHFLGVTVSQELVMGAECSELCRHVSSVARLLNDLQTFKKEREERKLNSVIIQLNGADTISEEEAVSNIGKMVEYHRKELLKLVVRREGSVLPKKCKDVFWKSCNIAYYLYTFTDEFTSPQQMKEDMILLFRDPVAARVLDNGPEPSGSSSADRIEHKKDKGPAQ